MTDIKRVRNLKPGQWFELKRTGEIYQYTHRDITTPGGIKHWVRRERESRPRTLHHSCHVQVLER